MDEEIKSNDVFVHNESGTKCVVVTTGVMKSENSQWYASVSYRNPSGENPETVYTRSEIAFREKFTRFEN